MSYISNALAKAQREREKASGEPRSTAVLPSAAGERNGRRWRKLTMAAVVTLALGVVATTAWWGIHNQNKKAVSSNTSNASAMRNPPPSASHELKATGIPAPMPVMVGTIPTDTANQPGAKTTPVMVKKEAGEKNAPQPSNDMEVRLLYRNALASQKKKEFGKAEKLYTMVLAKDPDHVEAMNNLGVLYMEQQRYDHAIRAFKRAVARKPLYVDPYYNLACLYAQYGDVVSSVNYLKKAVAINPEVRRWAKNDGDLTRIAHSEEFKALMEEGRNR
ncbi:MAG: tetratricopeptide repeat protein [Syntrophales bacterium]|nr:tetratricopeptide repeat protein [Syntrophales bacterium]